MEELAKAFGMEMRSEVEMEQMFATQRTQYKRRFLTECSSFDGDRDRFLYYKQGDAWICTEFIQAFEGINKGIIRVLNGVLLTSPPDNPCTPHTVGEYHMKLCTEMNGRWFVNLPVLSSSE